MTELDTIQADVVHPLTGELLTVRTAEDDVLARFLDEIRLYESQLREAKGIVNKEVLRRLDQDGKWTRDAGPFRMSAPSPAPGEEWTDPQALLQDLQSLVEHGEISREAAERAVRTLTVYRVQPAGVKALRKLGGIVAETVDRYSVPTERRRYVKVERPQA